MASPFQNQSPLSPATSLSSSGSSVSTSILEGPEINAEDRSFSPRLLVSRPTPSLRTPSNFVLPMPPTLSIFALPYLPNSKSSRSYSLRGRATPHLISESSLAPSPPERPKSAPLFQHGWARYPNVNSPGPAPLTPQPIYRYRSSHRQPVPASLPAPKRTTLHGNWLRMDKEKSAARERRVALVSSTEKETASLSETIISGLPSEAETYIIVFSVRTQKFRKVPRHTIFINGDKNPVSELPDDIRVPNFLPPLLVDGRMTIDEIPRWKQQMVIHWRSWDGQAARLYHKLVDIPGWLWVERNLGSWGKGKEMNVFIERG